MTKALSLDLRESVVPAVESGISCRRAAERCGVGAASAVRRCARARDMGTPKLAPLVLDGPINRQAFVAYVAQVIIPTLSEGDIVRWTISAHIREWPFERPSRRSAPSCATWRPIAPTSTQSKRRSPNGKRTCTRPPKQPRRACGQPLGLCSQSSRPGTRQTASPPKSMTHLEGKRRRDQFDDALKPMAAAFTSPRE